MGSLTQQVNLYRGDVSGKSVSGSTRALLIVGISAFAIVVALAGAGEFYLADLRQQRDAVAENLAARRAEIDRAKLTLVAPSIDPFLESEIETLHKQQRHLNTSLMMISRAQDAGASDVSAFFAGLARNTLDGLWFSDVGLSAGGAEVLLKGKTTEPALVPRLLQNLSAEKAFAGRTFRKVNFARSDREDGDSLVEFELRSAHDDEVRDAG